ncbi:hypothetical protein BX616_003881 [Lobosporangium transversale]|nr:hypothetical protein BX616_003881 [Lobosporangium transversale]
MFSNNTITVVIIIALTAMTSVSSISCQDQASPSRGVFCVGASDPCPRGYRTIAIDYDDPSPCLKGEP